jgi:hypothetical protein
MNNFKQLMLFAMVIDSFNDFLKKPTATIVQAMFDVCGESVFSDEEMPATIREIEKRVHDMCRHESYGRSLPYEKTPRFSPTSVDPQQPRSYDLFGVPVVSEGQKLGDVVLTSKEGYFHLTIVVQGEKLYSTEVAFEIVSNKNTDFSITNKLTDRGNDDLRAAIKRGLQGIQDHVEKHAKDWIVFVNCQI